LKTKPITINELLQRLNSARDFARANGQEEKVRIVQRGNSLCIETIPAYSELFPDQIAVLRLQN
jgi:hypothetical protein